MVGVFRWLLALLVVLCGGTVWSWPVAAATKTKLVFATRGGAFNASGVELRKSLADALIAEFHKQNPDIEVEWLRVDESGYKDKIATMFVAGQAPDIMEAWTTMGTAWAENGYLLDLRPYISKDMPDRDIKDFFPSVWEAPVIRVGPKAGMRYAIPRYLNVVIFYYNKTLFNNLGLEHLDRLDQANGWTWSTLVEYGKKLVQKTPEGKYQRYALRTDQGVSRSAAWAWANGGAIFDYPGSPTRFVMDTPAALEGYQFLYDLRYQYDIWAKGAPSFESGLVGMDNTKATDSLASLITQIGDNFEWDVAQRPMGRVERGTRTSLDLYVVSSQTKNPDAAWRFVKFLTSPKAQMLHAQIQGMVPIRKSLYADYIRLVPSKSLRYFFEGAINARVDPTALMIRSDEATSLIDSALAKSMDRNQVSVKQAIGEIADAVRALYR